MLSLTPFKDDTAMEMVISCEQFLMFKYMYIFYDESKLLLSFKRYSKKNWWVREEKSEYFPALEKDNSSLLDYLKRTGLVKVSANDWKNFIKHKYIIF